MGDKVIIKYNCIYICITDAGHSALCLQFVTNQITSSIVYITFVFRV